MARAMIPTPNRTSAVPQITECSAGEMDRVVGAVRPCDERQWNDENEDGSVERLGQAGVG